MNFFSRYFVPKDRKLWEQAELVHQMLQRYHHYERDVMKPKDVQELEALIATYRPAAQSYDEAALQEFIKKGERFSNRVFPPGPLDWIRENVEVMFVAVVVALAIRSYFLQPFKIPTHSMRPTLYGEVPIPLEKEAPNFIQQVFETVFLGRSYHSLKLDSGGTVEGIKEVSYGPWFTFTDVYFDTGVKRIYTRPNHVRELGVVEGRHFEPGSYALRGTVDSGDVVIVNRMIYHFRRPSRGDVFVFTTANNEYLKRHREMQGDFSEGSQFYIKRCVGVPGDVLSIREPNLLNHGDVLREPAMFLKIEAAKNGYKGYTCLPGQVYLRTQQETYEVKPDTFFAMGDNSYQSLDSRFWGPVPRENLVGTGLLVLWPFTSRWGVIR